MSTTDTVDPVILDSVRASLGAVDEQLESAEQDVVARRSMLDKSLAARDELAAKRAKLADYLVKHGAMASRSETPVVPVPADPVDQPGRTIVSAKGALDLVIAMAADGRYMKVAAVVDELLARNISIAAEEPVRRLTQVMSASKLFDADRALGWRLKVAAKPSVGVA